MSGNAELVLENRHTGERLVIQRIGSGPQSHFDLKGSLPPGREGPPMHIHFGEDEEGHIARPAIDLDRYLQAVFEIMNAGPKDRPSQFTWRIWPCGTGKPRPS